VTTERDYLFRVTGVEDQYDGDTFVLQLDIGFKQKRFLIPIRLDGADCAELHKGSDLEKEVGAKARDYTAAWFTDLATRGQIWCRTKNDDQSFSRWIGSIWCELPDGACEYLALDLTQNPTTEVWKYATVWPQHWHEKYDPDSPYWT
jgi:hypothetical protein